MGVGWGVGLVRLGGEVGCLCDFRSGVLLTASLERQACLRNAPVVANEPTKSGGYF